MKYSSTLLALFLFLCFGNAGGQTISGKVVAKNGEPIPFATIHLSGTVHSTTSDASGIFTIKIDSLHKRLNFSAVGFRTLDTMVIRTDTVFTATLLPATSHLSEVVVVGYAAEKKREITGSVTTISTDKLYSYADAGLYGKAAGVSIKNRGAYSKPAGSSGFFKSTPGLEVDKTGSVTPPRTVIPQSSQQASAKQLTAGEVNDFTKWKMWEDYSQTDFKALGKYWNLFTTERYCVLLQNSQHTAVIDKPVWLINRSTGDTVWQAVTDNTGKAELWAGVNKEDKQAADYVISCIGCATYNNPSSFANGVNKITVNAPCTASNNVDIAFVVDATGSMQDEIDYLKVELENILDKGVDGFANVTLRAGAVFYRDKDDSYVTKHSQFNTDLTATYNFIKQQDAGGGGDTPEAVNDGLRDALNKLQWSSNARARLLFLVLDAPPHDYAKDEMFTLMKQAAAKGIRVIPVVCSGADKSTEFMMRNIALTTNGTYVFLTDDSGIGDSHIKPTTDKYNVELLTDLLQRLIKQMIYVNNCEEQKIAEPVIKQPTNKLQLKIMPNPTQGSITINSNKNVKEMYVTDFTGKILMRITNKGDIIHLNIGDYPNGMYLIRYLTNDNEWGAEKVVLMH